MKFQDRLKRESRSDLWKEYCGFLELSIDDYMYIQNRLMEEQMRKWSASGLGRKFLGGKTPQTVDEFREAVPLTTYADYADVLLMKAEAKVRNGEDGTIELNAVRDRVGMPHREATLDNILEERLLELVWEGHRRQDLIRFGRYHKAYDQRMALPNEGNGYTTVFPIPQKSIELNPNLKQNKGYADKEL